MTREQQEAGEFPLVEEPNPQCLGYDEWLKATRTIREWANGGGVAVVLLHEELTHWAEESRDTPPSADDIASALRVLAVAHILKAQRHREDQARPAPSENLTDGYPYACTGRGDCLAARHIDGCYASHANASREDR